jgi:hypothetical protein
MNVHHPTVQTCQHQQLVLQQHQGACVQCMTHRLCLVCPEALGWKGPAGPAAQYCLVDPVALERRDLLAPADQYCLGDPGDRQSLVGPEHLVDPVGLQDLAGLGHPWGLVGLSLPGGQAGPLLPGGLNMGWTCRGPGGKGESSRAHVACMHRSTTVIYT